MRTSKNARIAGLLYLLLVIVSPLRYMYIPGALIVRADATATAGNIAAHESLFRVGMVSDLFCGTICIFIALALYRLLKDVDQSLAVLMVVLGGVMPSAIYLFNVVNDAAALILVRGAGFLAVFDKGQRDALAMSLTGFLWPRFVTTIGNVVFPALLGEPAFVLWLLVKGAKEPAHATAF